MKIEAVTVCVNFSNVLKKCLSNTKILDRWVIVTSKNDYDTIELCKTNNIEYLISDRIYENGASLAKGKAINDGFQILDKDEWLLHLDADIILGSGLKNSIYKVVSNDLKNYKSLFSPKARKGIELDNHKIIGNRCTKKIKNLIKIHKYFIDLWCVLIKDNRFPSDYEYVKFFKQMTEKGLFESKLDSIEKQNYYLNSGKWKKLPYIFEGPQTHFIGYFQLFHSSSFNKYPEKSSTIAWDDTFFTNSYPDDHKIILDYECVHIGYNGAAFDPENNLKLRNLKFQKQQINFL